MAEEIVIFRNVDGEFSRDDLLSWKKRVHKLGLFPNEKIRGKMIGLSLIHNEETITFYLYELGANYQLHLDYLRVKQGDGRLVNAIESLIQTARLRAEKFSSGRGELWRTLYVNGLVMDEGPFIERRMGPDFDLRISREVLMGHIYLTMDKYMEARTSGNRMMEEECRKILQEFVRELSKVDEVLQSRNRS